MQLNLNMGMFIEFECMLPPCCETFISDTGKNVTNRFNAGGWGDIHIAFIPHPNHRNEYIPLSPTFQIMQTILKEKKLTYTVCFERLKYNTRYWEESNAVLMFYIIQNPGVGLWG
jgi:hypothetical protein